MQHYSQKGGVIIHWAYCDTACFDQNQLQQAYKNLTPSRKAHIDRLRQAADRTRSLAAELLVQKLLAEFSVSSALLHRASNGQPYLTGCSLFVSISHCDRKVACAISGEPVGIDIERIRPIDLKLCRHICLPAEKAYVLGDRPEWEDRLCEDRDVLHRFFEIWTAKEAYFKKCGTGITDLKSVNVLTLPRQLQTPEDYILQII